MKIVHINTFPNKATGQIMLNIHRRCLDEGMDSYVVWGRGREPQNDREFNIYDKLGVSWHGVYTRITDKTGFASSKATKKLLGILDNVKPDVVHLHNIHGYYLNIEMLFNYLSENKIRVVWTLHDCWTFTGHCAYFDFAGCEKWKTGCEKCPQKKTYPTSLFLDNSRFNWNKKRELFTSIKDMTLVTPSKWLAGLVKQSFLNIYPVKVIHNGVDTNVFRPVESQFRERNGLDDKFIILGVASEWTERKGLKDFIELNTRLHNENDKYKIVLVGLDDRQLYELPQNIMGIKRTDSVQQLAEIYSTANVFFNPTYEDNYPTTNLEAISCKTPVITYNTGGSGESINADTGKIVECGNLDEVTEILGNTELKQGFNSEYVSIGKMLDKYVEQYNNIADKQRL